MIWWKYLLIDAALGVCIALILRRFVCVLCYVKGRSMMDTLSGGEIVFARRRRKHAPLNRFDVVLCRYPGRKGLFIKRVIGLPGDLLEIDQGTVLIDRQSLDEPYLDPDKSRYKRSRPLRRLGRQDFYVMGDHRDRSNDSRSVGPLRRKAIRGRALLIVWPPKRWQKIR